MCVCVFTCVTEDGHVLLHGHGGGQRATSGAVSHLPPCLGQGLLLIPLGATGSLAQEHLGIFLSQPLCL